MNNQKIPDSLPSPGKHPYERKTTKTVDGMITSLLPKPFRSNEVTASGQMWLFALCQQRNIDI
jgi:hypothetical protein